MSDMRERAERVRRTMKEAPRLRVQIGERETFILNTIEAALQAVHDEARWEALKAGAKQGFLYGYQAGHEDTVESRFCLDPSERWDEDEQLREDVAADAIRSLAAPTQEENRRNKVV